jgi:membrane protease YdiL (CAAX protease family)
MTSSSEVANSLTSREGLAPERKNSQRQIITYLLLVFAFSSVFYFLMLKAHTLGAGGGLYVLGIMWCPALAGMATLKLNGRKLSELGWKWPANGYAFQSWFIPILYATITYLIVWSTGLGGFPNHEFMEQLVKRMGLPVSPVVATVLYILLGGSFGLARGLSSALGEEIGWRGFFVPELFRNIGFTGTALISGAVWSCWHYPLLIWGDYNNGTGTPTWYGLTCFTVLVLSISFVFAWMRLKSASLWTGALLHASHNLYIQGVFTPLTRNTGKTAWFIDEFGAILPLVTIAFAIYFWRRRRELPQSSYTPS